MASNNRRKYRRGKPANTLRQFNTPNRDLLRATDKMVRGLEKLKKVKSDINRLNNRMVNINREIYRNRTLAAGANEFPGQNLTNPAGTKAMRAMSTKDWFNKSYAPSATTQLLRGPLTTDLVAKGARLVIGAGRTAKNLGAGLALNYLSDRFLAPHAKRAGIAIGEAMKRRHIKGQKRKKKKK